MKHSLSSLRYRLLVGAVDLRPLRVLAEADADWRGWRARLTILGASHSVCLRREDGSGETVTELLTCAPPAGGSSAALVERAISAAAGVETDEAAHVAGLRVAARIAVFALHEDAGEMRGAFAEECRLAHAFPGWTHFPAPALGGRGGHLPVTHLGWRVEGARLLVETVHTYPEEHLGVRTETRFDCVEEAAP